jgi:hypothetical protein
MTELPHVFCVNTRLNNREGYFLLRWSTGETDTNGRVVHVIKPANHHQRFYSIDALVANVALHDITSRKGQGNVTRQMRWRFTDKQLRDPDGMRIPVIRVTSQVVLPAIKLTSFIPIITNVPAVPAAPAVPVPEAPVQPKKYTIPSIPQHIIRALLTNAVMNSETCPITSGDIDVSNGAITSCFHFFEKTAITRWLSMPNSKDECPLCKTPCNSYTLDS